MRDERIRLLTITDLAIFHDIRLRACKEEPVAFMEAYEELADKPLHEFGKYFDNGWIAGGFVGDTLRATAGLFRHRGLKVEHKGEVWGVYCAPEARGQGLVKGCIALVLEEARKAGIELVQLSVAEQSPAPMALYRSFGFEPWGVQKHITKLADGSYVNDVMMVKWLE